MTHTHTHTHNFMHSEQTEFVIQQLILWDSYVEGISCRTPLIPAKALDMVHIALNTMIYQLTVTVAHVSDEAGAVTAGRKAQPCTDCGRSIDRSCGNLPWAPCSIIYFTTPCIVVLLFSSHWGIQRSWKYDQEAANRYPLALWA